MHNMAPYRNARLAVALGAGALILTLGSGCATKGFVRNEMASVRQEVTQLDQELDVVRNSAEDARQRADVAYGASGEARDLALGKVGYHEVGTHVVYFGFDNDELDGTAQTTLDLAAEQIRSRPDVVVDVLGFTDSRGSDRYNFDLGQRRANAVLRYLAARSTGQLSRFAAISYGKMAWGSGEMSQDYAQQRRVVVSLIERTPLEPSNNSMEEEGEGPTSAFEESDSQVAAD